VPLPDPLPPPPPQSFGHDALVSPVSQVLFPQTGFTPLPPPPPLPQSEVQLPTSLAAQMESPHVAPEATAASTPPPVPSSGLPSPHAQPTRNDAQTNTNVDVILIMRRIVLIRSTRSTANVSGSH
jgi:hypothetical protein